MILQSSFRWESRLAGSRRTLERFFPRMNANVGCEGISPLETFAAFLIGTHIRTGVGMSNQMPQNLWSVAEAFLAPWIVAWIRLHNFCLIVYLVTWAIKTKLRDWKQGKYFKKSGEKPGKLKINRLLLWSMLDMFSTLEALKSVIEYCNSISKIVALGERTYWLAERRVRDWINILRMI